MEERNFGRKGNSRNRKQRNSRGEKSQNRFSNFHSRAHERKPKSNFQYAPIAFETPICPICGQVISDIASALSNKSTGEPIHFDCAVNSLRESENLRQNETIAYIGQGRFGVITYPNPRDTIHFKIVRIIDWETKDNLLDWRRKISESENAAQEIKIPPKNQPTESEY